MLFGLFKNKIIYIVYPLYLHLKIKYHSLSNLINLGKNKFKSNIFVQLNSAKCIRVCMTKKLILFFLHKHQHTTKMYFFTNPQYPLYQSSIIVCIYNYLFSQLLIFEEKNPVQMHLKTYPARCKKI